MTEPDMIERISGVAIMCRGVPVALPRPYRHHHIIQALAEMGEETPITGRQGFFTNKGRFVGRREALGIAKASGQYGKGLNPSRDLPDLYSEDLW
jgi:hypothetical protein